MRKSFSEAGYTILRNAISKSLIKEIQHEIYSCLKINGTSQNRKYLKFCDLAQNVKIKEYDFALPLFQALYHKGLLEKMLLGGKFYNSVADLLGKDLAFCTDPGINT